MDSNQSTGKYIKPKKKLVYDEEGQTLDQVPPEVVEAPSLDILKPDNTQQ